MLLSLGKVLVIEDQLTSPWSSDFKLLKIFEDSASCRHSMNYDYDARESRWSSQGTLATSQTVEGICWFAWTVSENLLYSSYRYISTSGTHVHHKWIRRKAYSCGHTVLCSHGQEATR